MERVSRTFNGKNYWNKRGYNLLDGAVQTKRKMPIIRLKGDNTHNLTAKTKFFGRMKKSTKLFRLKKVISSPKRLWHKFRNGYINMMLRLAGDEGKTNGGIEFGRKRISKARQVQVKYKNIDEFEARLVLELYKALSASKNLSQVA